MSPAGLDQSIFGDQVLQQQPRARRRRGRKSLSIAGARLEHLVCCYNNDRYQNDLKVAEDHCEEQARDLQDLHRVRGEEVVMLSQEAQELRRLLAMSEEDVLCYNGKAWDFDCSAGARGEKLADAKENLAGEGDAGSEIEALQKQVKLRQAELGSARRRLQEAHKDAVMHRARLSICREIREMEVHEFRELLASRAEEHRPDAEEGLMRCLSFEQLTAKEVCKLSETESLEHQTQVTDLFLQLQKARGEHDEFRDGEATALDDPGAAPGVANQLSAREALQALRSPAEVLLSILEAELGMPASESLAASEEDWILDISQRLTACCERSPQRLGARKC